MSFASPTNQMIGHDVDPASWGPTAWLEIELSHIEHQFLEIRNKYLKSKAQFCAVVKANAYGLGVEPIAKTLAKAGVDFLAVYSIEQANALAKLDLAPAILVLSPIWHLPPNSPVIQFAKKKKLHLTIHQPEQLAALAQQCYPLQLHPFIDTGMSRSGLHGHELADIFKQIQQNKYFELTGLCTHFATAMFDKKFLDLQLARFHQMIMPFKSSLPDEVLLHVANTSATLRGHDYHLNMVRVGIGLYGYGAGSDDVSPMAKHALRWCSRVNQIQKFSAGADVGYGRTHTLSRDSVLGIVPMGYADGYPTALANLAVVRVPSLSGSVNHVCAKVLGTISMDQIVIDLTDLPEVAQVGLVVELISSEASAPNTLPKLAKLANTHCYAILTGLASHLPRKYLT